MGTVDLGKETHIELDRKKEQREGMVEARRRRAGAQARLQEEEGALGGGVDRGRGEGERHMCVVEKKIWFGGRERR